MENRICVTGDKEYSKDDFHISSSLALDDWTRLSISTVLAGYLFVDLVKVYSSNNDFAKKHHLSNFLNYLLSYPPNIGHNFDININTISCNVFIDNARKQYSKILLFSGGVDSTSTLLWLLDKKATGRMLALCVDYGQPYAAKEKEIVQKVCNTFKIPLEVIKIDFSYYINKYYSYWEYIIPARNFMFVCLGNLFCVDDVNSEIILCGQRDEIYVSDKSPKFYAEMSRFLDKRVYSPIINYNKTELLAHWKNCWIGKYPLHPDETITCYNKNGNCGYCKACFKRMIAFCVSGCSEDTNFDSLQLNYFFEFYLYKINSLEKEKLLDLLIMFQLIRGKLDENILEKYDCKVIEMKLDIEMRKNYLKNFEL